MRHLKLVVGEVSQWDAFYSVSGDADMLFVPTEDAISVGEVVRVRTVFSAGPQFLVSGVVVWRRPAGAGAGRLRPGVGVRLNASERPKIQYIRGFCRGGLIDKRGTARLPLRVRVTYKATAARRVNFTRDLTTTGVLLAAAELLPVGTVLELTLMPPLELPALKLQGEVVRHVEDDRGRAVGIRFDFASPEEEARLLRLVKDLERAFQTGQLGEEHIAK